MGMRRIAADHVDYTTGSIDDTLSPSHTMHFRVRVKARVYYSDSVNCNPTPLLRRPLEPSQFSVGMSDTQRNSPPDRSYMLTTNHVNTVGNKLPKLFRSYLVFYLALMCLMYEVNGAKSNRGK